MKHLLLTTITAVLVVGCGPKAPDISIHDAVGAGNIEAIKQHLAAGTDVDSKSKYGDTPLRIAAINGQKEIATLLITNGANVNARTPRMVGWHTPLHWAAHWGHKEIAELLIAKGADVNAMDFTFGRTLLHIAAREGHKEIVELLIAKGADVNAMDKDGNTPLDSAIRHSDLPEAAETAALLRKHGGKTKKELEAGN